MLLPSLLLGAIPALQESHPLASKPHGLLNHMSSSADFFFFFSWWLEWLALLKWCPDNGVSFPFWWRLPWGLVIPWFACVFWVSNGFSIFSMWKFSFSLVRDWALEKASGFGDPGFLYLWVRLEEAVHYFTLTSKSGRQKSRYVSWDGPLFWYTKEQGSYFCAVKALSEQGICSIALLYGCISWAQTTTSIRFQCLFLLHVLMVFWLGHGSQAGSPVLGGTIAGEGHWIMWCTRCVQRGTWKSQVAYSKTFQILKF